MTHYEYKDLDELTNYLKQKNIPYSIHVSQNGNIVVDTKDIKFCKLLKEDTARKVLNTPYYDHSKSKQRVYKISKDLETYDEVNLVDNIKDIHNMLVIKDIPFDELLNSTQQLYSIVAYSGDKTYTFMQTDFTLEDIEEIQEKFEDIVKLSKSNILRYGSVARNIWKKLDKESYSLLRPCFNSTLNKLFDNLKPFYYIKPFSINKPFRKIDGMHIDINSMYPSIYSSVLYPCGSFSKVYRNRYNEYLTKFNSNDLCGYLNISCKLKLKEDGFAFISSNESVMSGQYLPVVTLNDYWLTSVRFKLIMENYEISDLVINDMYTWYKTVKGIAKNTTDLLYRMKTETSGKVKSYIKKVLNSVNGSFAYNPDNYSYRSFNKEPKRVKRSFHSLKYLYAFTIDYANTKIINEIKKHKDNVLYSNIDSIVLDSKFDDYIISDNLGDFKLEHDIKYFRVLGYGRYIINNDIKCIGVNNKELLNKATFYKGYSVKENREIYCKQSHLYKEVEMNITL